jgi:hypothetical protein
VISLIAIQQSVAIITDVITSFSEGILSLKKNVERDSIDAIRSDRLDALDGISSKKM